MAKKYSVKLLGKIERDILKYRSYELMVFSFYAEDLKRFIIKSLEVTNVIHNEAPRKLKLNEHLERIVADGVISEKEKEELVFLLDYRNDVAHEIHNIVSDFGEAKKYLVPNEDGELKSKYQSGALFRLKVLTAKIHREFQSRYAMRSSFDKFKFEPAERALEHEMKVIFRRMLKLELVEIYKKAP